MNSLTLGTRGSDLALVQTRDVALRLRAVVEGLVVTERIIRTTGDKRLDVSLSDPGPLDKGLFTKELEEALLRGEIHAAVHSLKDLPTEQPVGLVVGAILERANPADCLASRHLGGWQNLPHRATVATCSPRRKNQLLLLRPDLHVIEIRGNVPTRLAKILTTDHLDALIVARAALDRLGSQVVPPGLEISDIAEMLPAPGQGAVAIECRADDKATLAILETIHHEPTARCVNAERELLKALGGGCHMPLGTLATLEGDTLRLRAALFEAGGIRWLSQ